jgi:hypothetical protein
MRKTYTMRQALEDPDLLGTILPGKSWQAWRVLLIAAMGEKLTFWERLIFKRFTGRDREPGKMVSELVAIAGRRAGKSRAASALACYLAALCDHSEAQAIGETLRVLFLAKDQKQAGVCWGYVDGVFQSIPLFRDMVASRTQDTITLTTGIALEVRAASASSLRGFTCCAVLADEAAHWATNESAANADTAILDAVRPSLGTTGGPLLILSSPYARKGEVFRLYEEHYGAKGDADILVVHGATLDFHRSPELEAFVERALQRNPVAARAEYLAEFRSDLEGFVSLEVIRACTGAHVELPPAAGNKHVAGLDLASGSGEDALGFSICHHDRMLDKIVVDYVRAWQPPFSPSGVLAEVADICRAYDVETVIGDRFAYNFAREMLRGADMGFRVSDKTTSVCFSELAPMLNANEVVLPRHQLLLDQLGSLERKPSSRGKEFIGHPPGGHDDIAAATAVAVTHCAFRDANRITWWFGDPIINEMLAAIRAGEAPKTADQYLADYDDEIRRRAYVRTGNLDYAGRPIEPTSNIPIVREEPRRIGDDCDWLH